jgi:predicted Zn-dependent protease
LDLPFSRFIEAEADEVGLHIAAKACYDVRHVPLFWRRQIEQPGAIELFSTHPGHHHRADDIEKMLPMVRKTKKLIFKIYYLNLFKALSLRDQCNCFKLPEKIDVPEIKKK